MVSSKRHSLPHNLHISAVGVVQGTVILFIGIFGQPEVGAHRGHIAKDVEEDQKKGIAYCQSFEVHQKHRKLDLKRRNRNNSH